ncbi:MAG: decarboxylase [candidate division NC10 bacterium]|nr:decarboxylase [candidate division NC10 bacterium]
MTGAQSLLQTLVNGGVEICFANPGTSEMHFIAAVDRVSGMRTVLGLFEGVCTGAADGYARMTGKPAATLLHLGPGLGNGFANLHNARRANTPLVNIVGDHATYHLQHDPPLATDIESIVRGFSGWVRRSRSAADVPAESIGGRRSRGRRGRHRDGDDSAGTGCHADPPRGLLVGREPRAGPRSRHAAADIGRA